MCRRRCRSADSVAVGNFVEAFDQIASLLKFDRKKERAGCVDSLYVGARRITAALRDGSFPEVEAIRIGISIQKIAILPEHKVAGQVDGIPRAVVVVHDVAGGRRAPDRSILYTLN